MKALLRFTKRQDLQNLLYDDFFHEANLIDVIAFNIDNEGSALCRCDGQLQLLTNDSVQKIIFGAEYVRLDAFINGIYNPDVMSVDLTYTAGNLRFRIEELNGLDKYDLGNLAKKIHKELQQMSGARLSYFKEIPVVTDTTATHAALEMKGAAQFLGNSNSHIYHRPECKSCNTATCTVAFTSEAEAAAAGYRPCKTCSEKEQ